MFMESGKDLVRSFTGTAIPDGAAVNINNRDHLGGGTGKKHLVSGPDVIAGQVGLFANKSHFIHEIENRPAEGESYIPTRTTVRGVRRAD